MVGLGVVLPVEVTKSTHTQFSMGWWVGSRGGYLMVVEFLLVGLISSGDPGMENLGWWGSGSGMSADSLLN